jgi:hypothetical protein
MVSIRKALEKSVDLLRFFGKLYFHQQFSNGHVNRIAKVRKPTHKLSQCIFVKVLARLRENSSNRAFGNVFFESREVCCRSVVLLPFWVGLHFCERC